MEFTTIRHIPQRVSRIGLGTWAMGGWMWGGCDDKASINTIHHALDLGINLIDTAPVYGSGHSEEIVGRAIAKRRDQVVLATKVGLLFEGGKIRRNSKPENIRRELEDSLRRLQTDYIDLYQVHWPDNGYSFRKTAEQLHQLQTEGKIRAIGVSNFLVDMMEEFGELDTLQPPYNLFEREYEETELPYCREHGIKVLGYGVLCRGLLSGRITKETTFKGDDIRKHDPKFEASNRPRYLECVHALTAWAKKRYNKGIIPLAVRFALDRGIDIPLWGCRRKEQLTPLNEVWGWKLTPEDQKEIEEILTLVEKPIGTEFIGKPR